MQAAAEIAISKSKFTAGMQCLKRLYFQVHDPDLKEEVESDNARFEQGREVGLLARSAFPGGVLVVEESWQVEAALTRTTSLIEDASVPAIFEGTFRSGGVLVRADVLERLPGGRWRLIEVKSSVESKDHYVYDLAIQDHVLSGCGFNIASAGIMHLNREYVYDGRKHDLSKLFTITDLTGQVRELDVPALLKEQRAALADSVAPDIQPGGQCTDPYECEFFSRCNIAKPENHISFLPNIRGKRLQALQLSGFHSIKDIPYDFELTVMQRRNCDAVQTGLTWVSDTLEDELAALRYPLYFMDFETLNPAIPCFEGTGPYHQLPFQWSVHRQLELDAGLDHFEFLAVDSGDPRRDFVSSLCQLLGQGGHIIAYNASFESQRLGELADWFPEFRDQIEQIQARLWDLLPVVRNNVYHPDFHGSFSLKSVLPALVPDLTYEGMDVANGTDAGVGWEKLIRGNIPDAEKERLKGALLAYCKQDTLAMVRVLDQLRVLMHKTPAAGLLPRLAAG
jgi:predicted RecB family nuclease